MSNVLDDEKQQQIRALGRLGWTLSRIQEATGVRRETISGYLKAAGHRRAGPRPSERIKTKTGNFPRGVHRLWPVKSGHFRGGVHRLGRGKTGHQGGGVHRLGSGPAPGSRAECERVRAVSRADHRGARARPQRHGDLAGPRRRPRLHRAVCERAALRPDAPRRRPRPRRAS